MALHAVVQDLADFVIHIETENMEVSVNLKDLIDRSTELYELKKKLHELSLFVNKEYERSKNMFDKSSGNVDKLQYCRGKFIQACIISDKMEKTFGITVLTSPRD